MKDARVKRDEARALLASGVDPSQQRKVEKQAQALFNGTTFKSVADDYRDRLKREGRAAATLEKNEYALAPPRP